MYLVLHAYARRALNNFLLPSTAPERLLRASILLSSWCSLRDGPAASLLARAHSVACHCFLTGSQLFSDFVNAFCLLPS